MFIGHFALGFAAKRWAPRLSLGSLFLAVQLADLVWPLLVLLGVERVEIEPGATAVTPLDFVSYPYSHSLVGLGLWGLLLAVTFWMARRASPGTGLVLVGLVLSHWVLDWFTHRPDLPLTFEGAPRFGLGLWNSLPATILVEGLLFATGVWLYARATRAKDKTGRLALWGLVGFLLLAYVANLFGPPPPSARAIGWAGNAMWLLVAWGYWVDRHRYSPGSTVA